MSERARFDSARVVQHYRNWISAAARDQEDITVTERGVLKRGMQQLRLAEERIKRHQYVGRSRFTRDRINEPTSSIRPQYALQLRNAHFVFHTSWLYAGTETLSILATRLHNVVSSRGIQT